MNRSYCSGVKDSGVAGTEKKMPDAPPWRLEIA